MRIITPALVVEEHDSFKNDVLDRKSYGDALLNLVKRSDDELLSHLMENGVREKQLLLKCGKDY